MGNNAKMVDPNPETKGSVKESILNAKARLDEIFATHNTKQVRRAEKIRRRNKRKAWKKIIAEDEDWDQSYFLIIIDRKLHDMLDFFSGGTVMQSDESLKPTIAALKECVALADKLMDECNADYQPSDSLLNELEKHEKHYVDAATGSVVFTNDAPDELKKAYLNSCRAGEKRRRSDLKKLFMLIAYHFDEWWD